VAAAVVLFLTSVALVVVAAAALIAALVVAGLTVAVATLVVEVVGLIVLGVTATVAGVQRYKEARESGHGRFASALKGIWGAISDTTGLTTTIKGWSGTDPVSGQKVQQTTDERLTNSITGPIQILLSLLPFAKLGRGKFAGARARAAEVPKGLPEVGEGLSDNPIAQSGSTEPAIPKAPDEQVPVLKKPTPGQEVSGSHAPPGDGTRQPATGDSTVNMNTTQFRQPDAPRLAAADPPGGGSPRLAGEPPKVITTDGGLGKRPTMSDLTPEAGELEPAFAGPNENPATVSMNEPSATPQERPFGRSEELPTRERPEAPTIKDNAGGGQGNSVPAPTNGSPNESPTPKPGTPEWAKPWPEDWTRPSGHAGKLPTNGDWSGQRPNRCSWLCNQFFEK
jgi:hypothetical protein